MLWTVNCIDKPNSQVMRQELRGRHREYLETVNHQIFFSSRQASDDGLEAIGTFFIIDAPDRAGAEAFIHSEPFYRAGMFESVSIRRVIKRRVHPEVAMRD